MNERGQTAYDYLLGIVLLLVAIITVLSLFPQVFGPFVDPVSTDREKAADRIAAEVIETNTTGQSERTLDVNGIDGNGAYVEQIKNRAGVEEFRNVNITVQGEGGTMVAAGDTRLGDEPSATVVRTVRTPTGDCTDGCQLIVRVW